MKCISSIFLFLWLVTSFAVRGQDTADTVSGGVFNKIGDKEAVYFEDSDWQTGGTRVFYQQDIGLANQQVLNSRVENYLLLSQSGNHNNASVTQKGSGNALQIYQDGDYNSYEGQILGNRNYVLVKQTGWGNCIEQDLRGSGIETMVTQHGSNNYLLQIENAGDAPKYMIHQKGDGIKLIIENRVAMPMMSN
jgi:hypothetical protein